MNSLCLLWRTVHTDCDGAETTEDVVPEQSTDPHGQTRPGPASGAAPGVGRGGLESPGIHP